MSDLFTSIAHTCRQTISPFTDNFGLKALLAAGGAVTSIAFGVEFYQFVGVIVVLVLINFATGVWMERGLSIARMRETLQSLIRYLVFIISGHLLQSVIPVNLAIENIVIIFVATTEFIFIAKHLTALGMPLPPKLLNAITDLRDAQ